MNSGIIFDHLKCQFHNHDYKLKGTYVFEWESDFFSVSKSGYVYEVEIKISRSDYFADFRKSHKHFLLSNHKKDLVTVKGGISNTYIDDIGNYHRAECCWIYYVNPKERTPNRFYYACPEGLLKPEEIPEYAGLIYINGYAKIVKEAPFLHKNKLDLAKTLLNKFYYLSLKLESQLRYLKPSN